MELSTEEKILKAAREVFIEKGLDGARMQEIADAAGINKALLHYYYRSKNLLFEAVYLKVFGEMMPKIYGMFLEDLTIFEIIHRFFDFHIEFLKKNPGMPIFILKEIGKVPDLVKKLFDKHQINIVGAVNKKVQEAVDQGLINPIRGEDLMLNMISLSVFQFAGEPMFKTIANIDDQQFLQMVEERKRTLPEFVINAIKK